MSKQKATVLKVITWVLSIPFALIFYFLFRVDHRFFNLLLSISFFSLIPLLITKVIDSARKKQEGKEFEAKRKRDRAVQNQDIFPEPEAVCRKTAQEEPVPEDEPQTVVVKEKFPVAPQAAEAGYIVCPSCGQRQRENRSVCMNCGAPFKL